MLEKYNYRKACMCFVFFTNFWSSKLSHKTECLTPEISPKKFLGFGFGFGYKNFWVLGMGFGFWVWVLGMDFGLGIYTEIFYYPNPEPIPKTQKFLGVNVCLTHRFSKYAHKFCIQICKNIWKILFNYERHSHIKWIVYGIWKKIFFILCSGEPTIGPKAQWAPKFLKKVL